jgi:hypothetical protein
MELAYIVCILGVVASFLHIRLIISQDQMEVLQQADLAW